MWKELAMPTVAVLGASGDRTKYSNKAVRAYVQQGWHVYPVNPKGGMIEGLPVFTSLGAIPVHINRLTIYLPPAIGLQMLPDIAAVQADEVFFNPGAASPALIAAAQQLGVEPILACSIVAIGVEAAQFPG
jgi:uncharacterized protein